MTKSKRSIFAILITSVMLMIAVALFYVPVNKVYADPTTYTITYSKQGVTILTTSIEQGSNLTEADIPLEMLPEIGENEMIYFMYTMGEDGTLLSAKRTGNDSNVIISNIQGNVFIYAQVFKDPSKQHKVTFNFPDGSQTTMTVYNGEDCPAPDYKLGFCERAKYSASLKNIREDMTIDVTVDKSLKYVFMIGCGTVLLAGIVVIVVIILKLVNTPEDDDDSDITEPLDENNSNEDITAKDNDTTSQGNIQNKTTPLDSEANTNEKVEN